MLSYSLAYLKYKQTKTQKKEPYLRLWRRISILFITILVLRVIRKLKGFLKVEKVFYKGEEKAIKYVFNG